MGVHLYTNGAWTDSGKIYRNSENLCPAIRASNGWVIGYRNGGNGNYVSNNPYGEWLSPKISILAGTTFTVSAMSIVNSSISIYFWNDDTYIGNTSYTSTDYDGATFTAPANTTKLDFAIRAGADNKTEEAIISSGFWVMFNTGDAALFYEPYDVVDWYTNHGHGYSSGVWD